MSRIICNSGPLIALGILGRLDIGEAAVISLAHEQKAALFELLGDRKLKTALKARVGS